MKQKILITSALPYVNNVPHLGNIIGAVLSADVFARFCRSFGHDIIYICGTDEHGTATETKALEEGVTPKQICDKYYKIHKKVYDWFNISFDDFGRTSTKEQTELTQDIFLKLQKNGFIVEDIVEQLYCEKCNKFLADRFVEGTCPYCDYEDARGDQCDNCSRMLNAVELKNPRCRVCSSTPVIRKTEHLFIDLPKLKPKLLKWIDESSKNWSNNAKTMTYAWIKEGLKKRAISRDLNWGVPIPMDKYKDKVFYVWFDAPIGYLSITKKALPDKWESWWKNKGVKLYQFMGKDNIPFHTIIFPASLIGSGDNYTMLYQISSTEYLNYEDGKFSKSRGVGIFGTDAIDTGIPADVFRYYLLVNRPEKSDSDFRWDDFREKNNNELVANLGNLVNRTITFINRFFENRVPEVKLSEDDKSFLESARQEEKKVTSMLENVEIKDALKQIMHISKLGNQYFQENEPWKKVRENPERAAASLYVLANFVSDLAIMIRPYIPDTSDKIFNQLNIKPLAWDSLSSLPLKAGHEINKPEILFTKLEDSRIDSLKQKFSSKEFPLKLRVAKILEAKEHPDADKLVILQIDLGDEKRQIVAGIKAYYSLEELVGKQIVVVTNLKPAKLRGQESNGMLLAASKDESRVVLVDASGCEIGEELSVQGLENSQKQVDYPEFSKINLEVKDNKLLADGKIIDTDSGRISIDADDGWTVK